jgi:ABC-type amino acid transport system permease subunit
MMSPQAETATVAWDMVACNDSIPLLVTVYALADLNDFSGNLMAEHQRGLLDAIPFHDIAATDTAGFYTHQEFTRAYLRRWDILYPDVVVVVIPGYTHELKVFLGKAQLTRV